MTASDIPWTRDYKEQLAEGDKIVTAIIQSRFDLDHAAIFQPSLIVDILDGHGIKQPSEGAVEYLYQSLAPIAASILREARSALIREVDAVVYEYVAKHHPVPELARQSS